MKSHIHVAGKADSGVQTLITNQNTEPRKAMAQPVAAGCVGGGKLAR